MRAPSRFLLLALLAALALVLPLTAGADVTDAVSTFTYSNNMHPLGYSPRVVPLESSIFNTDLAFWGKRAYQGTYEGFRIVDITEPDNPVELENFTGCVQGTTTGNQGDEAVWSNILVRSWNNPAPASGAYCGGIFTPPFQEGVHVFDVSNPTHPVGLKFVRTPCGSHTLTVVPDLANGQLLVYSDASSGAPGCEGIDIIKVPLANPAAATYLRFEPSGNPWGIYVEVAGVTYGATFAAFGPLPPVDGISGDVVLVNDGVATTTDACEPLVARPAAAESRTRLPRRRRRPGHSHAPDLRRRRRLQRLDLGPGPGRLARGSRAALQPGGTRRQHRPLRRVHLGREVPRVRTRARRGR